MHIIPFLGPFLADSEMRFTTEVAEGTEFKMGIGVRVTLPPGVFAQECDFRGVRGARSARM